MRIALITASVGGIDEIPRPVNQDHKYHYHVYDENNLPFPLPNLNNRLRSKYLKIQTHRFLPDYDLYIWIDGRVEVISESFVQDFVDKVQGYDIVTIKHKERKTVFEELEYIINFIKKNNHYLSSRYETQQMGKELEFYEHNSHNLEGSELYASGIFIRWNNEKVNQCFDEWWRRTIEFSYFDQAMLTYTLSEAKLKINSLEWDNIFGSLLSLGKHKMDQINLSYENVYDLIRDSLRRKIPFSLVRYGDGEAMLLDPDRESLEYKNHVFKRQLGREISEVNKSTIIQNLISTYQDADVIGIPTPRHERKGEYWEKALPILNKLVTKSDFCSIDIHFDFINHEILDKLLMNRENLFYVNSNNLDKKLKERYNIKNIYSYIIAPEIKFTPDYNGIPHYPDHFNKVRDWIDSVGCRGELCLVGGGVVGKKYCSWFKERGGVALDIGSVFDNWAGKLTRGVDRGANKTDNQYKL